MTWTSSRPQSSARKHRQRASLCFCKLLLRTEQSNNINAQQDPMRSLTIPILWCLGHTPSLILVFLWFIMLVLALLFVLVLLLLLALLAIMLGMGSQERLCFLNTGKLACTPPCASMPLCHDLPLQADRDACTSLTQPRSGDSYKPLGKLPLLVSGHNTNCHIAVERSIFQARWPCRSSFMHVCAPKLSRSTPVSHTRGHGCLHVLTAIKLCTGSGSNLRLCTYICQAGNHAPSAHIALEAESLLVQPSMQLHTAMPGLMHMH